MPWRSLSHFYDLPADLRGMRTLDVCSGMSDFAFRLRQKGAEAYALDVAYHDLMSMASRHRDNFDATSREVFGTRPDSAEADALHRSFVQGFIESLEMAPFIYVAGSATSLPFQSNSFDLVTSFNGLFGALDFEVDILVAALEETVRVTRPGGEIQIVPYLAGPVLNAQEQANQRQAVALVERMPGVEVRTAIARNEAMLGGNINRLTITKTPLR